MRGRDLTDEVGRVDGVIELVGLRMHLGVEHQGRIVIRGGDTVGGVVLINEVKVGRIRVQQGGEVFLGGLLLLLVVMVMVLLVLRRHAGGLVDQTGVEGERLGIGLIGRGEGLRPGGRGEIGGVVGIGIGSGGRIRVRGIESQGGRGVWLWLLRLQMRAHAVVFRSWIRVPERVLGFHGEEWGW